MSERTKAKLDLHKAIAAVMNDERFIDGRSMGTELRQFIVAYHWARFEHGRDRKAVWARTLELAGLSCHTYGNRHTQYQIKALIRADAPRYEPTGIMRESRCPVPMQRGPRAGEPCGKRGSYSFRVTDPDTGEWESRGWCRAHEKYANEAREIERSKTVRRKPNPNTGGLLPGYIRASNWHELYAASSRGWEPPEVGIDANDWPVLVKVNEAALELRAGLVALDGGGEATTGDMPTLRLVTA